MLITDQVATPCTDPIPHWFLTFEAKPSWDGFAQKVVFTTIWFFSAISAYLCDLCVSVVARNI